MAIEKSDIDLVMQNFGCDYDTAVSFIEAGLNVNMLRDGIDDVVEPEMGLRTLVDGAKTKLTETVAQFKQDSQYL